MNLDNLTPEQIQKITGLYTKFVQSGKQPNKAEIIKAFKELGIPVKDIEKICRQYISSMTGTNHHTHLRKIQPNSECICGSKKKYKKCCFTKIENKEELPVKE